MAILVSSGRECRFGFAEQTTFGTVEIDSVAITEMNVEAVDLNPDIKVVEGLGYNGTRNHIVGDVRTHTSGSQPTFTVSGPVKILEVVDYLYAFFQNVTEASTPFGKTYTPHATQPDFSNAEGYFLTCIDRYPTASTSTKVKDVICKNLTFSCERGGQLMMSAEMIGTGAATIDSNPSGTWTRNAETLYDWEQMDVATLDFGSGAQALLLESFELSYSQDVVALGRDGSGDVETYGLVNRDYNFTVKILKDAHFESGFANLYSGTGVTGRFGWGNATAGTVSGDLDFVFDGMIYEKEVDKGDILFGTLKGRILADDTSTTPTTIIACDNTDRSW